MGIVPSRKIRMLHTDELEKALKRYPDFQGVYAVDELPTDPKPGLYIANTDPSYQDGVHWVLFYICKDGTIEFFDSFGRKPLERWPGEWKYSTRMVQSPTSNACGYHVLCYAYPHRWLLLVACAVYTHMHSLAAMCVRVYACVLAFLCS